MRVAAIVPAYNEEQTIGPVIEALLDCQVLDEIIVVSDGSDDHTVEVASKYPVNVVELAENVGKGGAMRAGADVTACEVLLFVDADLVGLQRDHIEALLEPVLSGRTAMSIGVFSEGRRSTDLAQKIAPSLSGQRAVRKDLFDQVPQAGTKRLWGGSCPDPLCRETRCGNRARGPCPPFPRCSRRRNGASLRA